MTQQSSLRTLIMLTVLCFLPGCGDATETPQLEQAVPASTDNVSAESVATGQVELEGVADGGGWVFEPEPDTESTEGDALSEPDADTDGSGDVVGPGAGDAGDDAGDASGDVGADDAVVDPTDVAPPECVDDQDCGSLASEGPCVAWRCSELGVCESTALPDDAPCDDQDSCSAASRCEGGECVAQEAVDCDDGDPCTEDTCDAALGCVYTPTVCDDDLTCTVDVCEPDVGCVFEALQCDQPDNPCQLASCSEEQGGCVIDALADGVACQDDNPCTSEESCQAGQCVGVGTCECEVDADCLADSDLCAGIPVCVDQACTIEPDSQVECAGSLGPCLSEQCNPSSGQCEMIEASLGAPCDAGACQQVGVCLVGQCVADPISCDDDNPCTADSCDPATGQCVNAPLSAVVCDDDNACTEGDVCADGACVPGTASVCDCQADVDCVDGWNPCNGVPFCDLDSNTCAATPGSAVSCEGGEACAPEQCDPTDGACKPTPVADGTFCDDGSACTQGDQCDAGSCKSGDAKVCSDGDLCTVDTCEATIGCVYEPGPPCDDGDLCTVDSCDPQQGCITEPLSCDDGDACTVDSCDVGQGCLSVVKTCPDSEVPCTVATCDATTGCSVGDAADGASCSDSDACTKADRCEAGICVGDAIVCDGGGPCLEASCEAGDCVIVDAIDGSQCDDDDACTDGDRCTAGACIGELVSCDDQEVCTVDACIDGVCSFEPVGGEVTCDDGSVCSEGDTCAGGQCQSGKALDCDDNDPCTIDACDPTSGCVNTSDPSCPDPTQCVDEPAGEACDDGDADTTGDMCLSGVCAGFSRITISAADMGLADGATGLSATHVGQGDDGVWTVAVRAEDDGAATSASSALFDVTNEQDPVIFANTKVGLNFVALHGRHAATSDGDVWYRFAEQWATPSPYSPYLLEESPAVIEDLWSVRLESTDDEDGASNKAYIERLWIVGSDRDATTGEAEQGAHISFCEMTISDPSFPGLDVDCADQLLDSNSGDPESDGTTPKAVAGVLNGGGVDEGSFMVIASDLAAGGASFYNDVFENASGDAPLWTNAFFDTGAQAQVIRDSAVASSNASLNVGSNGHLRARDEGEFGPWGFVFDLIATQGQRDFTGVWVSDEAWIVSATRTRPNGNIDIELWVCPVDADITSNGSWTRHTLEGGSDDSGLQLNDVWGDPNSGSVYAVGAGVSGQSGIRDAVMFVRNP